MSDVDEIRVIEMANLVKALEVTVERVSDNQSPTPFVVALSVSLIVSFRNLGWHLKLSRGRWEPAEI